jgi:hypothetical protein
MFFEKSLKVNMEIGDKYRVLVELLFIYYQILSERDIHFIANWHAIFELDYEEAPDFW